MTATRPSPFARLFKSAAVIEPVEMKAVLLSMLYFFFLFGSYSVVKPVRDAMGTVYGMAHIQELFTGTFLASFLFAPLYSGLAARIRLSTFLPWVYGFVAITILLFYALFQFAAHDRGTAAAFYIWVSTFNILIISVFWTSWPTSSRARRPSGCSASWRRAARWAGSPARRSPLFWSRAWATTTSC